jgi:surface protein
MSDSINRYNRDHNIDGPVFPFAFVPEYGSKISFENKNVHFNTADNYYKKFSKGVNGTTVKFNLKFSNRTEDEARSFLYFIEEALDSGDGNFNFNTTGSSGVEIAFPTGSIYKNIDNLLIQDYDFKFHNGLFDIDLNLLKNGYSSLFDWSGSSYLNTENFYTGWEPGVNYKEFDVIYYPEYLEQNSDYFLTGNYYKIADRRENFYYCSSGHVSGPTNSPTGSGSAWSRSFFYEIDDDISIGSDRSSNIFELKDSFSSFIKSNQNDGLIKDLSLSLKNRSDKEARSIIHFIEKNEDYRPIELTLPQLYNKKKFFVVKSFNHKFVYKDCNDIEITLDEIFLFKKPDLFDNYRSISSSDDQFIMNVNIFSPNDSIRISGENENDNPVKVGWGDGQITTIDEYNDPNLSHQYAYPGDYEIRVSGYMPNITVVNSVGQLAVRSIEQLGIVGWDDLSNICSGYTSMTSFKAATTDISLVTNMDGMFRDCSSLTGINLSGLSSSAITGMQNMFRGCSSLNVGVESLAVLDTSSVVDMSSMFEGCISVDNFNLYNFDTSIVTGMESMFENCTSLTGLDVSSFDTSAVVSMKEMFYKCQSLSGLDVSNFDTSIVTGMQNLFGNCESLTGLDVSNFDTSSVTSMRRVFGQCFDISGLDTSTFNTSSVTDMGQLFASCTSMTGFHVNNFDTSSVTKMDRMFYLCSSLTGLDLSTFDTSNVTDMDRMFDSCVSATALKLVGNFDTSQAKSFYKMFYFCNSLLGVSTLGWNTSNVTTMEQMYDSCYSMNGATLSSFDTSNVTNMSKMFYSGISHPYLNVSSFNTSNVTDMSQMFFECRYLTGLNVENFDTSKNKLFNFMFYNCGGDRAQNGIPVFGVEDFNIQAIDFTGALNQILGLTKLNTLKYDELLVNWKNQDPINDITVDFGQSTFTSGSAAATARTLLLGVYNWSIGDGGPV